MPGGGKAHWVRAGDGTRLRAAIWPGSGRGTAILMPGRTEYIEKYGPMIGRIQALGLGVVVIDWRGQGLADRPIPERSIGYVADFAEYQDDLASVLAHPAVAALPGPRVVMAHSMGGCIALRALVEGLDVAAAVFSAPMFGIKLPDPVAPLLRWVMRRMGEGAFRTWYAPSSRARTCVTVAKLESNTLTSDKAEFERILSQARAAPELTLGGPSLGWFAAAEREMRALAKAPPPALPILTFLGLAERIVEPDAIRVQSSRQPDAKLVELAGARHEIWMERADVQELVWAETADFLERVLEQGRATGNL